MKETKLAEMSLEDLKAKEATIRKLVIVYAIIIALLFVISAALTFMQGFSVFTVFPIIFFGAFVPVFGNLRNIQKEIANRVH